MEPQDALNRIKDLARQDPTLLNDATGEQMAHLLAFVLREMRQGRHVPSPAEEASEIEERVPDATPAQTAEEILALLRQEQAVRKASLAPRREPGEGSAWGDPPPPGTLARVAALEDLYRTLREQAAVTLEDLRQTTQQGLRTQAEEFSHRLSDLRREAAGHHMAALSQFASLETRLGEHTQQMLRLQDLVTAQRDELDALRREMERRRDHDEALQNALASLAHHVEELRRAAPPGAINGLGGEKP